MIDVVCYHVDDVMSINLSRNDEKHKTIENWYKMDAHKEIMYKMRFNHKTLIISIWDNASA